ncbi:50S ribosomal protein L23 [gamma proteobacterium HdN1]|nr:50S ribosomal protein L23 [gamma proteobacterium HdN1]
MNQERIFKVLVGPHVSEKASVSADKNNSIVFKVARDATKVEIKTAVEKLWDVKVKAVRTVVIKGKSKKFGRFQGRRQDWKKAYVALHEGYDVDFLGAE